MRVRLYSGLLNIPIFGLCYRAILLLNKVFIGRRVQVGRAVFVSGPSRIESDVVLEDNVTIQSRTTIGKGTTVKKGSNVSENLPRFCLSEGNPAVPIEFFPAKTLPKKTQFLADEALDFVIRKYPFETILDVGSGGGLHAQRFRDADKEVTCVDFGTSHYFQRKHSIKLLRGDYMEMQFDPPFDCVWASHVLEHQPNANLFLRKLHSDLKEGGVLAVTVPPMKHEIVGGHLSLWNAGMLLYHLIFAGFDCRNAHINTYGYNISIVVKKNSIELPELDYDCGDVERLKKFFPFEVAEGFDGRISKLNWE